MDKFETYSYYFDDKLMTLKEGFLIFAVGIVIVVFIIIGFVDRNMNRISDLQSNMIDLVDNHSRAIALCTRGFTETNRKIAELAPAPVEYPEEGEIILVSTDGNIWTPKYFHAVTNVEGIYALDDEGNPILYKHWKLSR